MSGDDWGPGVAESSIYGGRERDGLEGGKLRVGAGVSHWTLYRCQGTTGGLVWRRAQYMEEDREIVSRLAGGRHSRMKVKISFGFYK